jgi:hypothetical protein
MLHTNGKHRKTLDELLSTLESNNSEIHSANFEFMTLSDLDISRICKIIKKNSHLTSLSFSNTTLKPEHIAALAEALKDNQRITSISGIVACGDDSDETKENVKAIMQHTQPQLSKIQPNL